MNRKSTKLAFGLISILALHQGQSATVNVGAVATTATTGQFLTSSKANNTTGLIKVGFFSSKTSADLASIVNGWGDNPAITAYQRYSELNSFFTQIGTAINPASTGGTVGGSTLGLYTTAGAGWNFSSTGGVSGTANYADLSLVPQNSVMYIWAFNNSDFSSSAFNITEWALVTNQSGISNWKIPGSGTLSLQLANVIQGSDAILGTDLGASIQMVAVVPEPSVFQLLGIGVAGVFFMRTKRERK